MLVRVQPMLIILISLVMLLVLMQRGLENQISLAIVLVFQRSMLTIQIS
jgi:hypothetical protein